MSESKSLGQIIDVEAARKARKTLSDQQAARSQLAA